MVAILFCKLGQNYYQNSFPSHIYCANLMKLAAIFQDLEHLYDFKTIAMAAILFFKMRPKYFHSNKHSLQIC